MQCEWRKHNKQLIINKLCNEDTNYAAILDRYIPKITYI